MNIQDYMQLPYNYVIKPINDESGSYFYATVLEMDGCQSSGESFEETYNNLRNAMEGWIETKLDNGYLIPHPLSNEQFSGKFIADLPKSLHAKLAIEAKKEGVSLNQYVLYKLSS